MAEQLARCPPSNGIRHDPVTVRCTLTATRSTKFLSGVTVMLEIPLNVSGGTSCMSRPARSLSVQRLPLPTGPQIDHEAAIRRNRSQNRVAVEGQRLDPQVGKHGRVAPDSRRWGRSHGTQRRSQPYSAATPAQRRCREMMAPRSCVSDEDDGPGVATVEPAVVAFDATVGLPIGAPSTKARPRPATAVGSA